MRPDPYSSANCSYHESIYGERRPLLANFRVANYQQQPQPEYSARHYYYQQPGYQTTTTPAAVHMSSLPGTSSSCANGTLPHPMHWLPHGVQPHRNPFAVPPRSRQEEEEEDGINCSPCCDDDNIRRTAKGLALGQILSLCLCGTGVSSTLLFKRGVNAPAAQSFMNYFLLCFVYCTALFCKGGDDGLVEVLRRRWWKYLLLAFIDVEANYMIVYAYQFTSLTSVQLLDCSTIPTVMLLSWLFLSVRYLISHIVGVCVCLVGIACLIWADILDEKGDTGGNNKAVGDMLCLGGALLYAVANVSEEFLVKQYSRMEYLGMIGLFGVLISGVQMAVLEHKQLGEINWNAATVGCFALFAISMFIFYSLVTVVLQKTSALMFNLATLTADFYSLLFGLFLFKDSFHYLYFVSFIVVIIGSIIYSIRPTQIRDADEPRRVCPCFFACCCCCGCFFEETESTEGSLQITAPPLSQLQDCPVHGRRVLMSETRQ